MSERRAARMAVAFIERAGGPIGRTKLLRLMYLAEREAMRRLLLPIIEDDVCATQDGMVLSRTSRLAKADGSTKSADWGARVVQTPHGLAVREGAPAAAPDDLGDDELEAVQRVWDDHDTMTADELARDVHRRLPEWLEHWPPTDAKATSVPVSRLQLHQSVCGVNEAEARYLVDEYRAARDRWITSDPDILGGTPAIVGTRVSVYAIRGRLEGGDPLEDLLRDYPRMSREAALAARMYAKAHPLEPHPRGRPWELPTGQARASEESPQGRARAGKATS